MCLFTALLSSLVTLSAVVNWRRLIKWHLSELRFVFLYFSGIVYVYVQAYLLSMDQKYLDEVFKCADVVGKRGLLK